MFQFLFARFRYLARLESPSQTCVLQNPSMDVYAPRPSKYDILHTKIEGVVIRNALYLHSTSINRLVSYV